MTAPEQHDFGQRDAVRASLLLADATAERHGVFALRPKPVPEPTEPDEAAA